MLTLIFNLIDDTYINSPKSVSVKRELGIAREPGTQFGYLPPDTLGTQLGYSQQVPPTLRGSMRTFKAGTFDHGT